MFMEIATPQNGVQNSFQPGRNNVICQCIVWSVLKWHDMMARYKRHNYKDDPTVGSELVKLLALNSGYEVLDSLKTEMITVLARGRHGDPRNSLRWDSIKLKLPGDPGYNPSKPRAMKWDE
jgi:hypothetical protein